MENLVNYIALIIGVPASLTLFYFVWLNRGEPWRIGNLLTSFLLIAVAAFMLALLSDTALMIDKFNNNGDIKDNVAHHLMTSYKVWVFIFPAVAGGVGVSVLANFLQAKKPPKNSAVTRSAESNSR